MTRDENHTAEDADLVRDTLDGQTEAFRGLVERYSGLVYNVAYGMLHNNEETSDAVQEIFYRAFRGLSGYKPQYPFGVWLRRIAVNYLLDVKKKKRIRTVSLDEPVDEDSGPREYADDIPSAHEQLLDRQQEEQIRRAITQLREKYRVVMVLRHFEDMSYEDIAETLGCPVGTVMTRLHRARQRLAEVLSTELEGVR